MTKSLKNSIISFLSDKRASFIIVLTGIAGRIIQLIFFYNIRSDGSFQVLATQNLVNGHGISTALALSRDVSVTVYKPLVEWPPGYSLLLAPFYILSGHNYIIAGLALDILAAILLILATRTVLKHLQVPIYLINLHTLITSFFIYYFYFIDSSDAIAIAIFMVALSYLFPLLQCLGNPVKGTLIITVCLLACAFIKYLLIPVVFLVPAYLLVKGLSYRNRTITRWALVSLLLLTTGIAILLLYQKANTGTAAFISSPGRGFFPEHLLDAYPFIPASFIKPDTVTMLFAGKAEGIIFRLFQILHLLLCILVSWYIGRMLRDKGWKTSAPADFFYLSYFISLTILALLMLLSLSVTKEEILPGWFWTYVEEPRYYGLCYVCIHLGLVLIYRFWLAGTGKIFRALFYIFFLLLVVESGRGLVFDVNRIRLSGKEEYSWQYENRFQKYSAGIVRKLRKERPGQNIVITGPAHYYNNRVCLYNHLPLLNEGSVNDLSGMHTKKPVTLLVVLHQDQLSGFQPFLRDNRKVLAGRFESFYFYSVFLCPKE